MKEEVYHLMARIEASHWWFEGRRRIVDHLLQRISLPDAASVLEIGCGTGGNFEMLSRYGSLSALDVDATAIGYASARGIADVRQGSLPDDAPFLEDHFDLVVLLDVLEHIDPDQEALQKVHRLMAPGGNLFLTVPAFPFLWSPHDDVHEHKRRYTRGELVEKVRAAGIRVTRVSYFNTLLFPLIAAIRIGQRFVPHGDLSNMSVPPAPINRFLANVIGAERYTLPFWSNPVGVSLLLEGERDR